MAPLNTPLPPDLDALMGEPISDHARIGLLGGSFNPAHEGHLHITLEALERLGLDQVWWLVSPQNPLKPKAEMAELEARTESAEKIATHSAIRVSNLESTLGTRYTVDTVEALLKLGPRVDFVWLMGADNWQQLPQWHRWQDLMQLVPVAILDRTPQKEATISEEAARIFAKSQWTEAKAKQLAGAPAPAWVFLETPRHPQSASEIRAKGKWPVKR